MFPRAKSMCQLVPDEGPTTLPIQTWMTRIIQNWMIVYPIQNWMTRIIQNCNYLRHPKVDDDDYCLFLFYIETNEPKSSKIG